MTASTLRNAALPYLQEVATRAGVGYVGLGQADLLEKLLHEGMQ